MKRPFLTFLSVVVVPSTLAIVAALFVAERAWDDLAEESGRRAARLALGGMSQELGAAVAGLVESAAPLPEPDTTLAAVRAALSGDTVTGLDSGNGGLDVFVLLPDTMGPGTLRFGRTRLEPTAPMDIGPVMAARIGLYVDGEPWVATDPGPGMSRVDRELLLASSESQQGLGLGGTAVVALDPRPGTPPRIVAVARTEDADRAPVSGPVRLVLGLVLLFASLAGWILLAEGKAETRSPKRARTTLFSLSLVPALATAALLVHVHRTIAEVADDDVSRDLTRAIAVADRMGQGRSPTAIKELTGYDAVRLEAGSVAESTLPGQDAAFASIPAPPPSFTTSGIVSIGDDAHVYVARRIDRTASVLTLTRPPVERIASLRSRMVAIGVLLGVWLAAVGAFTLTRRDSAS